MRRRKLFTLAAGASAVVCAGKIPEVSRLRRSASSIPALNGGSKHAHVENDRVTSFGCDAHPALLCVRGVHIRLATIAAQTTDDSFSRSVDLLIVGNLIAFVWVWGLIAIYVRLCFRSAAVPKDQKVLWVVLLVLLNVLAMPVFWFKYIWRPIRSSEQVA
jgi:hypothetical protein